MTDTLAADPPAGAHPPGSAAARSRGGWWWTGLRPLVLRLHFYVGIFVGPFLLVAAATGLLYTVTPQLEQLAHRDALTVPAVGDTPVPLGEQVVAAAAAVPDGTVTEIRPPRSADGTTRVGFDAPGVAEDYSRTAFVDPYTGQVRAVLDTYGEWLPVRAWIDELHRTLHLGPVGRLYSEVAASWLGVLALSGVALWTARRRRRARLRRTLLPEGTATGRVRLRSWHGAVGLWAAIGMLFLSATGLTWSQFAGANVTALRASLDWSTPTVATALPGPAAGAPAGAADPAVLGDTADRVLAAARAAGLSDPVALLPGGDGEAWVVEQVQRSWPEKQDAVAVDPTSATIVDTLRFADWPLAAKLARWGVDAHMGLLFGAANQVALATLALAVICMVVWGYRMWWLRRPTRGGRAGPPGGDLLPDPGAVLLVGAVAVLAGVALPALGVTLVVFLLVDIGRQQLRDRRTARP
ncbi:PepSY-associated TM helix domain-containing protein [Pseudonocardia kunmingensis]|uniref:Putative iron-regulated membrane protein n=1 Tax=Pseudonocardia kunmingensis TaxID=630975 RepID=A0A543DRA3_9PSEU|nr:PepSY-associated TM helix domain-containing protein [Pseudonocardia kunmingensis]TQM11857.1 putative iron-regulated membrane protein [Pseudonocardia kunmingensis]